jgi:hypothetical protein
MRREAKQRREEEEEALVVREEGKANGDLASTMALAEDKARRWRRTWARPWAVVDRKPWAQGWCGDNVVQAVGNDTVVIGRVATGRLQTGVGSAWYCSTGPDPKQIFKRISNNQADSSLQNKKMVLLKLQKIPNWRL